MSQQTSTTSRPELISVFDALNATGIHKRTGENQIYIWVWAIAPLFLHFLSTIVLILLLNFCVDNHDFNLHSRKALSNIRPLQSDITTAVSSGVTIVRFFAALWSAGMIWRCIFILMEKDGISLQQINILFRWQNHFPRLRCRQKVGLVVSIILLLSFPCQLSGPILTGSITWSSSSALIRGGYISPIPSDYTGDLSDPSFEQRFPLNISEATLGFYSLGRQRAINEANVAWLGSQGDRRTMKRVLGALRDIPVNSTLTNVTLPYFGINKLEWIKDPINELSLDVLLCHKNSSNWNPFFITPGVLTGAGTFAIVPDTWGVVSPPSLYDGIITETRFIVGNIIASSNSTCDYSPTFGDMPANIGQYNDRTMGCFIYGRITYVAGAAKCTNCRVSSPFTVQNDTEITLTPSNATLYALAMMPEIGGEMIGHNFSLPSGFNNLDEYVTEFFIRSYSASWAAFVSVLFPMELQTDARIAVPTSRANILWWRVVLWLWTNLIFTMSGLLFLFVQVACGEPIIGTPSVAAFLLDTTEILHRRNRALCDFSMLVDDDKDIGYLYLQRDRGHKRVVVRDY